MSASPQQVYENFLKNKAFQQDMLQDDGKILHDGYPVPSPETDFKPSEFDPEPDFQDKHIDHDVLSGMAGNF
jgi:hypothetical protein